MHDLRAEYLFNRPPRTQRAWRTEKVRLPEPPLPPAQRGQGGWLAVGMPVLSAGVMIGATAAISRGGGALLFGVPMLVMALMGVVTTVVMNRAQARRDADELARRRAFFEEQLAAQQARLAELYDEELHVRREAHPTHEHLLRIAGALGRDIVPGERLWERRVGDPDFLELTIGRGRLPFSSSVEVPAPQRDGPVDPRLLAIADRFRTLEDVPITVPLREVGSLGVSGPRAQALALVRGLIWQAAVFHAPTELRLAIVYPRDAAGDWEAPDGPWGPWLPHTIPLNNDTAFSARMHASDDEAVAQLMSTLLDQLSRRRDARAQQQGAAAAPPAFTPILVVVDGAERLRDQPVLSAIMREGPLYNMLAIFLVGRWQDIPGECGAMVDLGGGSPRWSRAGQQWSAQPLTADLGETTVRNSDKLARKLASIKLAEAGSSQDVPRSVRLFDLLGIDDEADLRPPAYWAKPPAQAWHPDVPIGQKSGKAPLAINLYEQAHGPHGIIAGATGAGKSVLLQSVIAALAIKHSPLQMQLLLIDFKGGASLAQLAKLPHTVGFVTDLEGRLAERAMTAIKSELRYRKLLFRAAEARVGSKVENIAEYRAKAQGTLAALPGPGRAKPGKAPRERAQGPLPPLPNLLIVIDEFDEMVQSYKEFVAELVRVVKQGRSLGVHLLLASQQPAKAVTDDIRTQLKFFIALRLGSSEDSREMLKKPDAAFLPTDIPGRAYFRVGADTTLFQVAQVTGAYRTRGDSAALDDEIVLFDEADPRRPHPRAQQPALRPREQKTDLDVLVPALAEAGAAFLREEHERSGWQPRPIWQPPLPARLTLAQLCPARPQSLPQDLARAWRAEPDRPGWLQLPIGRLDIPQESRQEDLCVSLADSHLAIIGASGSGKTMLLRTLLLSLALSHAPDEVWCYVIDAGGQGLQQLGGLPHVGGLIQARERERVRRLISLIDREILRRQDLFRAAGAADLPAYRRSHGADLPAWVVAVDKLALLREEFKDKAGYETITEDLVRLARVGRPYGIHMVITADSARDVTHQLLSLFDTRIALRLPELYDYNEVLGTRVTSQIPASVPGRGLAVRAEQGALELQVALPLLEAPASADAQAEPLGELSARDEDHATVLDSELAADLKETVESIASVWAKGDRRAAVPAPVQLLPDLLALRDLAAATPDLPQAVGELAAPLGLDVDRGVAPLRLGGGAQHALVLGGPRSGKTTALQTVLLGLARRFDPDTLRFLILDVRRGLHALRDLPHTEHYAASEAEIEQAARRIEQIQAPARAPGRSWLVVVDDYDVGYKHMERQFRPSWEQANLFSALKRLAGEGPELAAHLLVATQLRFPEELGEVVASLEAARNGLILWPHKYDAGTRLLDTSLPIGERDGQLPPGRGVLVGAGSLATVQVALAAKDDRSGLARAVAAPAPEEVLHD